MTLGLGRLAGNSVEGVTEVRLLETGLEEGSNVGELVGTEVGGSVTISDGTTKFFFSESHKYLGNA